MHGSGLHGPKTHEATYAPTNPTLQGLLHFPSSMPTFSASVCFFYYFLLCFFFLFLPSTPWSLHGKTSSSTSLTPTWSPSSSHLQVANLHDQRTSCFTKGSSSRHTTATSLMQAGQPLHLHNLCPTDKPPDQWTSLLLTPDAIPHHIASMTPYTKAMQVGLTVDTVHSMGAPFIELHYDTRTPAGYSR